MLRPVRMTSNFSPLSRSCCTSSGLDFLSFPVAPFPKNLMNVTIIVIVLCF